MRLLGVLGTIPLLAAANTKLSDASLKAIPRPTDFDIHDGALLSPILTIRVPNTPGIVKVRQHFFDFLSSQLPDWVISTQNSTQKTPISPATDFVNIIATRDPPWTKAGEVARLTLVAHYDSKITPEGFIGATDSAAPCAQILHAARSIDAALTRKWTAMQSAGDTHGLEGEKGIQILLLDGEEAFVMWSDEDSIYGARSLAEQWESTMNPAMSTFQTPLHEISLFVLLDLLGAKDPLVPSYFKTTHWAYKNMAELESRLREQKLFKSTGSPWLYEKDKDPYSASFMGGMVQDDHLPFMARGVEILHLIPSPFPSVWHSAEDDGEHLDMPTTEDWAVLTAAFAAEWMDLEGFMVDSRATTLDRRKDVGTDEL